MKKLLAPRLALLWIVILYTGFANSSFAKDKLPELSVSYIVTLEQAGQKFIDVQMQISGATNPTIDIAIPAWTPGSYEILNYAQYVSSLYAENSIDQKPVKLKRLDKQTWRINTPEQNKITVHYKVKCERLAADSNWLGPNYGCLQGAATFLYIVGESNISRTIEFNLPSEWKITGDLEPINTKKFSTKNYDALVDSPIFIGKYVVDEFSVGQSKFSVLTIRKPNDPEAIRQVITKIANVYAEIMKGLPFDRYLFAYLPDATSSFLTEGLEHANSTLIIYSPDSLIDTPSNIGFLTVTAHELFHAWNVKRLRPKELARIDYTKEAYTPSLWFAEGITDYYTFIGLVRANLFKFEDFLNYIEHNIETLENASEHKYMSVEDASLYTWLTGTSGIQKIPINYYDKGFIIGLMLDIELRAKSNNLHSLDELIYNLYDRFSKSGDGYTVQDIIAEANHISGNDLSSFFTHYVMDVDDIPYEEFLKYMGAVVKINKTTISHQGFVLTSTNNGLAIAEVIANTPAELAGMKNGDILLFINEHKINSLDDYNMASNVFKTNVSVNVVVRRDNKQLTLTLIPNKSTSVEVTVSTSQEMSPNQIKIRQGIFHY